MTHKGRTRLKTPAAHQPQTHFADCKFTSGGDPIELGFVSSLSQPGGNVTGVSFLSNELGAKRLELLRELVPAATEAEIDTAFAEFSRQGIAALRVGTDSFFVISRDQIVALANRLRVATMYSLREFVVAGGLISYAPSLTEVYRQAAFILRRF
jgi:putative tryptophan/tyrosine transport system substrate-binding protein